MAVVRLGISVPDEFADELANELSGQYVRVSSLWRSAVVRVIPDTEIRRERDILRALAWFLPREG